MLKLNRFLLALACLLAAGCCLVLRPNNLSCDLDSCQKVCAGTPEKCIVRESCEIEQAFKDAYTYISKRDFVGLKALLQKSENYKLLNGDSFIDALLKDFCDIDNKESRCHKNGIDLRVFQEQDIFKVIIFLVNSGADYKIFLKVFIEVFNKGRDCEELLFFDFGVGLLVSWFAKIGLFDNAQVGEKVMEAFINYAKENNLERSLLTLIKIIFQKSLFESYPEDEKIVYKLIESSVQYSIKSNRKIELIAVLNMILDNGFSQKYKKIIKQIANNALQEQYVDILQIIIDSKIKISKSLSKKIKLVIKSQKKIDNPVVLHTQVLKELKENFKNKSEKNNQAPVSSNKVTQTESFLRVRFDQKGEVGNLQAKDYDGLIERILKEEYCDVIDGEGALACDKNMSDYVDLIKSMVQKERENSDCYAFYHANSAGTQIVFDVQTSIIKWLKLKNCDIKDIYFRSKNVVAHDDIKDFMRDYDEKFYLNFWPDCYEPMRSQVLSVNLCPFGNTGCPGECSLYYFIAGVSCLDPVEALKSMFDDFGLCKDYIEKIKLLYSMYIDGVVFDLSDDIFKYKQFPRPGNMLQIFIPKDKVDKFAYLSEAGGAPFRWGIPGLDYDESKKRHVSLAQAMDKYINDPYEFKLDTNSEWHGMAPKGLMNFVQARIVFMPSFYDKESGIKIFKYNFASEKNKEKYKKEFDKVINQMMSQWIDEKGYEKMVETDGNKKLLKLLRYINAGKDQG